MNRAAFIIRSAVVLSVFVLASLLESTAWAARKPQAVIRQLPEVNRTAGMPLMQALASRKSTRSFKEEPLSDQQVAELLWAACGINRKDGRRTIATTQNWQDILVYLLDKDGVWLYRPKEHDLEQVTDSDIRHMLASQFFVKNAAVSLLYVSDTSKMINVQEPSLTAMSNFHAGEMAQNVSLYCASAGLGDVIRGHFTEFVIKDFLDLPDEYRIVMTHTIGIPAE